MKLLLVILFLAAPLAAQSVSTGMSFLKIGPSARALGMGEAFTAVSGDLAASFYNPAGLAAARDEVQLMHRAWFAGTTANHLAASASAGDVRFSVSLQSVSVDDIELRTMPGEAAGTFSARNIAIGGSAALRLMEDLWAGVSARFLFEKIFTDEAQGYGLDAGLLYRVNDALTAGVSLQNIGSMSDLRDQPTALPTTLRGGAAWRTQAGAAVALTGAFDIAKTLDDDATHLNIGAEAEYDGMAAVRAGYQTGYESRSVTGGIGLRYAGISVDYAFVPFTGALQSTHTVSLSFLL